MSIAAIVRQAFVHMAYGSFCPASLLVGSFLFPEPYSHPFFTLATAPTKLMPFLENRQLLGELTIIVFGRMTPNYAPITILILIVFWFTVGLCTSILLHRLFYVRKITKPLIEVTRTIASRLK